MAARNLQELNRRRAARARQLAAQVPEAREALSFLAEVFEWRGGNAKLGDLIDLVEQKGPAPLREAARSFSPEADYSDEEAEAFFARCMLGGSGERSGAGAARSGGERAAACPECGGQPQGGVLRPLAHGDELKLFCSDCFGEWTFARGKCAVCGETEAAQLRYHTADRLPHLRTMTCDGCKSYLHLIDLSKEVQAVPEVDEIAAVALDIWAVEQGYSKPRPNLAGI